MEKKTLTLDEIKASEDLPTETVPVPEWGGSVVVRGLNLKDGMALLTTRTGSAEEDALNAFIAGVIEPKFAEADKEWLRGKNWNAVVRVNNVFMELSGLQARAQASARKKS